MKVYCLDCKAVREMNRHLRCAICNSDAVDTLERLPAKRSEEIQDLVWVESAITPF